jgi:hypothetical protein
LGEICQLGESGCLTEKKIMHFFAKAPLQFMGYIDAALGRRELLAAVKILVAAMTAPISLF